MSRFTDVKVEKTPNGFYDLAIDTSNRDFATVSGIETPVLCSLFSDRRASVDEVADPWKRRGWIGNLVSDTPSDNYGSGLWLYEQRRATADVRTSLRMEVIQSLEWMREDGIVKYVDADINYDPAQRKVSIRVLAVDKVGGESTHSFELWSKTRVGVVGTNS